MGWRGVGWREGLRRVYSQLYSHCCILARASQFVVYGVYVDMSKQWL